ncbi:MAG: polyketide cyclase [Leptolyngbya sp. SIOISBB]|nr:polyketide cyclase [Leptolyngbya sp. SIOISBB]
MKFRHTVETFATPEKIWAIWTDVEHWPRWDTELQEAFLNGPFELGAMGKLTPKRGRVSTFRISQFNLGTSYTFTVRLPLCTLNVHRYLVSRAGTTYFTHEVSFRGLLAFIFGLFLGRQFKAALPDVMNRVKRIAETE